MRPRAKMAFLILMTVGGILPLSVYFTVPVAHGMVRFGSYSELENFLLTRTQCIYASRYAGQPAIFGMSGRLNPALPGPLTSQYGSEAASNVNPTPTHSETNNQVAGVDELDTVKTDGQYIYTVTNNTVAIVNAYPVSNAQLVSRISPANQTIKGIFVDGNRLSIISEAPRNYYGYSYCGVRPLGLGLWPRGGCYCSFPSQLQNTTISIYDLTSRSSPRLQTTLTVNGTFIGARRISDIDYLISSAPARVNETLPMMIVNGRTIPTQAMQVYHSDISDAAFSYTSVVAVNASQDNPTPTVGTYLLGTSSTIYVSLTNIFLTQPIWDSKSDTAIHRISISNSTIKYEATGLVPGHVLNQYSLDEYQGYFRVVTTVNPGWAGPGSNQSTAVYVLDESLKIVGGVEDLGHGENFHAARFLGDKAYLDTFKKTDPLFVIGLGDPANPKVLGQLNVTGYSDYLQTFDESHLIGIGKDAVDEGSFAWYQGVKVSLFDVSDPTKPAEIGKYVIGDRGSDSPALTDGKAVLLDAGRNLLVIPVTVNKSPDPSVPNAYGIPVWQGAYVFEVTATTLTFRGGITLLPSVVSPSPMASPLYVTRTLYIGNVLYTISEGMIGINDLASLQTLGSVILV